MAIGVKTEKNLKEAFAGESQAIESILLLQLRLSGMVFYRWRNCSVPQRKQKPCTPTVT
jgi:hypothetical protein